jgi:peptidoglycan/LPS O-acetylase OafA/YrhL
LAGEDATARIAAPQLVSPVGPAPAQSLLAVLASYILPGSGPLPAGTIVLLVMLGVMLVAACAPRPGGSERIWLSGLLGPGRGHGLAVRRPG